MTPFSITRFLAAHTPNNRRFFTIAIDGRGGSGKSALADYVKRLLPDFVVLNGDDYFEPIDHPEVWGDFNDERFKQDIIKPLKHGNAFLYPPYDWQAEEDAYIHDFKPQNSADVVLDGMKLFTEQIV